LVLLCVSLTFGGVWLSLQPHLAAWIAGQILTAAGLLHWFVLLHECGHETLFRSRRWHRFVGPVAGAFSLIPFASWTRVHGRHHKWTGWQDLDPTTVALVPRERSKASRVLVNVCWRLWIPLFSCVYRIENYWNLPRLKGLFTSRGDRRAIRNGVLSLLLIYAAALVVLGPALCARAAALGILLSFAAEDVLLLSQHTHVPQHVSHGEPVRAYPAPEQEVFTRSLRLPGWASMWLLHFDAHELHHMYPFVPGYHLRAIPYQPHHEIGWWQWIRGAKKLSGEVLLFQNREESGWEL
jgi:acyl-lipid omega-6 desaturase (Delta-12 desaturase)